MIMSNSCNVGTHYEDQIYQSLPWLAQSILNNSTIILKQIANDYLQRKSAFLIAWLIAIEEGALPLTCSYAAMFYGMENDVIEWIITGVCGDQASFLTDDVKSSLLQFVENKELRKEWRRPKEMASIHDALVAVGILKSDDGYLTKTANWLKIQNNEFNSLKS